MGPLRPIAEAEADMPTRRANWRGPNSECLQEPSLPAWQMSGYRGVTWKKREKKWYAQILEGGRRKSLGLFTDKKAAAEAWDEAARRQRPPRTAVNFPRLEKGETKAPVRTRRPPAQLAAAKGKGGDASKYVGVRWVKTKRKYVAGTGGRGSGFLGYHTDARAAAEAFDAAARKAGKTAYRCKLNFPTNEDRAAGWRGAGDPKPKPV